MTTTRTKQKKALADDLDEPILELVGEVTEPLVARDVPVDDHHVISVGGGEPIGTAVSRDHAIHAASFLKGEPLVIERA